MSAAPSPLQQSNARHAAKAEAQFTPKSAWDIDARKRMARTRQAALEAGTWPDSEYNPIPQPARVVDDLHSLLMTRLYRAMQEIGKGKLHRERVGEKSAVGGRELAPLDYVVRVSIASVSWVAHRIDGLPPPSIRAAQRALHRMETVHSIIRYQRGAGDSLREATTFRLPPYGDVLAARRADPAIATTDSDLNWSNGRSNSRRPLTPEQAKQWKCDELPAREKAVGFGPTHTAPAAEAREREVGRPSQLARPAVEPGAVTVAQIAALSALCGREVDKGIANNILAAAEAMAESLGKAPFPRDGLIDLNPKGTLGLCNWVKERARKLVSETVYDASLGRLARVERWDWNEKVSNPPGYILGAVSRDRDLVADFVDAWNLMAKRAANGNFSKVESDTHLVLRKLRQKPGDKWLLKQLDDLRSLNAEAFEKASAAFAAKHPEPAGTPREVGAKLGRPRTFSDALDPAFVEGDEERAP